MSLLLMMLLDPLILWFDAERYRIKLHAFTVSLIFWLPFQYTIVLLGQILRVVGRYKSSSLIQILACVVGFGISYWLIGVKTEIEPLKSVVYSNAAIAILAFSGLSVLLFSHIKKSKAHDTPLDFGAIYKRFAEIFYTTCLSQSMAVVFIFVLTKILAQQGEKTIEIYAYLTRIEQLILMLSAAFISVMIPEINKMKMNSNTSLIDEYIHQGTKFLLGIGVILVSILFGSLTLFNSFSTLDGKLDQTLLMFVALWILGTAIQSTVILFSQLLNVLYSPREAMRLNFIRFVGLGIPMIMLGNNLGGILGLASSLLLLHIVSLYISRRGLFTVIKASYMLNSAQK
ncbi:hypothetical protein Sden_1178 [Shewanella denitrificans OS217]|uniref:Polysaccharide biosynthesis protein n=2 Tax=Shewanella TaxID=22 RepID=Q12Q12_SHEDO|nr:hypothetical protein Sden_1178 [Shewanella denitrificans OS217]